MESMVNVSAPLYHLSHLSNISTFCPNLSSGGGWNATLLENSTCERPTDANKGSTPVIIAIIITALYSIVCVLGLVGNVLVMYVIIR
ncbi:mu-type opioid receptor [Tachysurus ichikawai]